MLVLGVGGVWHNVKLTKALEDSRQQNARAQAVTEFLQDVLKMGSPEQARVRRVTISDALDEASQQVGTKFAGQPLIEAQIRTIIGIVYMELGKVGLAGRQHRAATEILVANLGEEHLETAASRHHLAQALYEEGFPLRARVHVRKALDVRERRLGPEHEDTLRSLDLLANTYWSRGQYREAEKFHQRLLDIRARKLGSSHVDTWITMAGLARDLAGQGKHDDAKS